VIVAVGANADGRREVLGMQVGPSEAETYWTDAPLGLARRGCGASSWSSPTPTRASGPPSPRACPRGWSSAPAT
jgi:hypothetical protein